MLTDVKVFVNTTQLRPVVWVNDNLAGGGEPFVELPGDLFPRNARRQREVQRLNLNLARRLPVEHGLGSLDVGITGAILAELRNQSTPVGSPNAAMEPPYGLGPPAK